MLKISREICSFKGLLNMLPNKDTTGTVDRRPDSGRPPTVHTTAIIHQVEDLSLSQ